MLMLLFVSVLHRLMASIAQKMPVYQFLLPPKRLRNASSSFLIMRFSLFWLLGGRRVHPLVFCASQSVVLVGVNSAGMFFSWRADYCERKHNISPVSV